LSCFVFAQTRTGKLDETEMNPIQLLDIKDNLSLINLIATPEKYNGKRIQVIGYLHLEFESTLFIYTKRTIKILALG